MLKAGERNRWYVVLLVVLGLLAPAPLRAEPAKGLTYPKAKKTDQVDDFHGAKVADPYRWMEATPEESEDLRNWIEAENKVTFGFLAEIPERSRIKERLTKVWDYERFQPPFKQGGKYFFSKNSGLQNQNVYYVADSLDAEPRVLLDPNTMSAEGVVALSGMDITDDARLLAYGVSEKGSDWQVWRVKDIATGKDLPDEVRWVKWSGASFTRDGQGFFYSRYDEPAEGAALTGSNYYHKLYFHQLGTSQSKDQLIYDRKDEKEWGFSGNVTDDGRYLIITVTKGTERKNLVFYKDLQTPDAPVVELIKDFEAEFDFVDNDGPVFWFQSDSDAPRYRLLAIDTKSPDKKNWKTVIPESKDTLRSVGVVGDQFIAQYMQDAKSAVKIFDLAGKLVRDVQLPGLGTALGFGGKRADKESFYGFTSYTDPGSIYRYNVTTGESTVWRKPKVDMKLDDFETKQVFYPSKDGTKIPMFITQRKDVKLDGQNPTILYGYGGFNQSITPGFRVSIAVWLEMGGVYAVANLRGGGEYGKDWHNAGRLKNKQNVFDDFIAAAEWLIANKYTSKEKLAINGGSNGGLLVGAVINQRPDLFAAALPAVGVMDMFRFHKFTIGHAWRSDYGDPDVADDFKVLQAYSPLHNLKPGTKYPATMITTADHDDRVVPAHSFKYAAALQEAHQGPNPVMIRIQTKAGHGAGKPTSMQIDEAADVYSFLVKILDMKLPTPGAEGQGKKSSS